MVSSFRPKYQRKNLTISALEFLKWSNHKLKALYNVCTTLNSPYKSYSDYSIVIKWLYFVNLPTFQILGQKLSNFFVGILVETMIPKGHFEINWPLRAYCPHIHIYCDYCGATIFLFGNQKNNAIVLGLLSTYTKQPIK